MNTFIDRIKNLQNNLFDVYIPKWEREKEPDYTSDHFLDTISGQEKFAKSEEIIKILKKLICNEQVSAAVDNSPKLVHEYTYTRTEGGNTVSNY
jgi:hypothetical protein